VRRAVLLRHVLLQVLFQDARPLISVRRALSSVCSHHCKCRPLQGGLNVNLLNLCLWRGPLVLRVGLLQGHLLRRVGPLERRLV